MGHLGRSTCMHLSLDFCPDQTSQEGIELTKNKQLRAYCSIIYILYPAVFEYHRGRNWFDKTVHKVWAKLGHPEPDRNKVVLSNL